MSYHFDAIRQALSHQRQGSALHVLGAMSYSPYGNSFFNWSDLCFRAALSVVTVNKLAQG